MQLQAVNRPVVKGLVANVVLSVGLALLVNGVVFVFFRDTEAPSPDPGGTGFDPPGWLVGSVWILLFGLMGAARWMVVRSQSRHVASHAALVALLVVFCALYPFYTLGLRSVALGLAGNIVTVLLAAWVAYRIKASSTAAAAFVCPVIAWVSFAAVLTAHMLLARLHA